MLKLFRCCAVLGVLIVVGCGSKSTHVGDAQGETVSGDAATVETTADSTPVVCPVNTPCDDGNPCTKDDLCQEDGSCKGTAYTCQKTDECTIPVCNGDGTCSSKPGPGKCIIDGKCYDDGAINSENPCEECISSVAQDKWTPDDTNSCDDNSLCTKNDRCESGRCVGDAVVCPDDTNPCTDAVCDPKTGCGQQNNTKPCDDDNKCTVGDVCKDGACTAGPTPLDCRDGDQCTKDLCDPKVGCYYINWDTSNDGRTPNVDQYGKKIECDGNVCTQKDICSGGKCCPGGICNCDPNEPSCQLLQNRLNCDDQNECTTDSCDAKTGCVFANVQNGTLCDDGDDCRTGDSCQNGVCTAGPTAKVCEDNNPCTVDSCKNGQCAFDPVPQDTICQVAAAVDCCLLAKNPDPDEYFVRQQGKCSTYGATKVNKSYCPQIAAMDTPELPNLCLSSGKCTRNTPGGPIFCGAVGTPTSCDNGNSCVVGVCDTAAGCLYPSQKPVGTACSDGNTCTNTDKCDVNGICVGIDPETQDTDGNACTQATCKADPNTQQCVCAVYPVVSTACNPSLIVWGPPRAAMIEGDAKKWNNKTNSITTGCGSSWVPSLDLQAGNKVIIRGRMYALAQPNKDLVSLKINGALVVPDSGGCFTHEVIAQQGMNKLIFEINDGMKDPDTNLVNPNRIAKRVQTFYYSNKYNDSNKANGDPDITKDQTSDGLQLFLDDAVWEDEFEKIFTAVLRGINIASLIPNPVATGSFICDYKIRITGVQYDPPTIDLDPKEGALGLVLTINNFKATVNVDSCISASPQITVKKITVSSNLEVAVNGNGQVTVTPGGSVVNFSEFDVPWYLEIAEGPLSDVFKNELINAIDAALPGIIGGAFAQMSINTSFPIPAFFGSTQGSINVLLASAPSAVVFKTLGSTFKLKAAAATKKVISDKKAGSITRSSCLGTETPMDLMTVSNRELRIALHDDVFNQILYSVWLGGLLKGQPDLGGVDLSAYGINSATINVDFLLPPIITGCQGNKLRLQIGDIQITATVSMALGTVTMVLYASIDVDASMTVNDKGQLTLALTIPKKTDANFHSWLDQHIFLELASITPQELIVAREDFEKLIKEEMLPGFLGELSGDKLGGFEIPEIDLSQITTGQACNITSDCGQAELVCKTLAGKKQCVLNKTIKLSVKQVLYQKGFTILSGDIEN